MEKRRNLKDAARDPLAKKERPAPLQDGPETAAGGKAFKAVAYVAVGLVAGLLLGRLMPVRFWR
jgi:hypothetical protein